MFKLKTSTSFYAFLSIVMFAYVLIRAINMGITYDEAWTITAFVPESFIHIINCTPCDANNHLLNTLLIKCLFMSGNNSVFIARLPNVLAFIMYLYFAYKISSENLSTFYGLSLFILLIANPFLLYLFSIARGYGLALGFQMASLYFLVRYMREYKNKRAAWAIGMGALAVLGNFSELNYWLPMFFVIMVFLFFHSRKDFWKTMGPCFALALVLSLIIYEPIRKLVSEGHLYYGGNTGFYSDSLVSLAQSILYLNKGSVLSIWCLDIFLGILIVVVAFSFIKHRKDSFLGIKPMLTLLLVTSALIAICQHCFLGTKFPYDRAVLPYYAMFVLVLCFSVYGLSHFGCKAVLIIVVTAFSFNFLANANFYKTITWDFDSRTPEIFKYLNKAGEESGRPVKVDFSWPFKSAIYFYKDKKLYPFVRIVKNTKDRDDLNMDADYYIYYGTPMYKVGYAGDKQKILEIKKDTVMKFEKERVYVFRNMR